MSNDLLTLRTEPVWNLTNHRSGAAPACVAEEIEGRIEGLGLVVGPIDKHCSSNDQIAWHKSPGATVETVVAIVAHYKITVGRNDCRFAVDGEIEIRARRIYFTAEPRGFHLPLVVINVVEIIGPSRFLAHDVQRR